MADREPIGKKLRFEVFKRDNFACQYCGGAAPDVILHVDHINPVAGGGDNELINLVTSCQSCNLGKGARRLDDDTAIVRQRAQLEELNERREQLEMMLAWRESMADLDEEYVNAFDAVFSEHTNCTLNDHGRKMVKGWLKRHDLNTLIDALEAAIATYYKDGDTDPEQNNILAGKALNMTPRIVASQRANSDKPWMKDLFYIRAIARNRFSYHRDDISIVLLKRAFEAGIHLDDLKDLAKTARNWSQWKNTIEDWIDEEDGE